MENAQANPLRSLVRWSVVVFILFLLSYVGLALWAAVDVNQAAPAALLSTIRGIGGTAWEFARPLLQLSIILIIIDWLLRRLGVQLGAGVRHFDWNVQAIIAIVVISAFAIAELGGISGGGLKDVALVVVGFYFGTQRRAFEIDPQTGKIRQVEEHMNPVHGTAEPGGTPDAKPEGRL